MANEKTFAEASRGVVDQVMRARAIPMQRLVITPHHESTGKRIERSCSRCTTPIQLVEAILAKYDGTEIELLCPRCFSKLWRQDNSIPYRTA